MSHLKYPKVREESIGIDDRPGDWRQSPSPTCLHFPIVSPCYTAAPRGSQSSTQNLGPGGEGRRLSDFLASTQHDQSVGVRLHRSTYNNGLLLQ